MNLASYISLQIRLPTSPPPQRNKSSANHAFSFDCFWYNQKGLDIESVKLTGQLVGLPTHSVVPIQQSVF